MSKGPISQFIEKHYLHFNAAALVDAAKGYETHLLDNGKMMVTLAGAMSTAELGKSLAEMIRQDKIHIISCTGRKPGRRHHEFGGAQFIQTSSKLP
jgi:deoxyhypusine synthase